MLAQEPCLLCHALTALPSGFWKPVVCTVTVGFLFGCPVKGDLTDRKLNRHVSLRLQATALSVDIPCSFLPCLSLPCTLKAVLSRFAPLQLPCPALPCPALPCPALPCPALPCPVAVSVSMSVSVLFSVSSCCLKRSLSKKKTAEKKVAITVFSFPPDKGNVGTAAYLNVFGSIYRVLQDLKAQGYTLEDVPEKEEDLIKMVCKPMLCMALWVSASVYSFVRLNPALLNACLLLCYHVGRQVIRGCAARAPMTVQLGLGRFDAPSLP